MSSRIPWFTPADYADFDALIWAFVEGVYEHRKRCGICAEGGPWCDHIREAFYILLDWKRNRQLQTKAEALRDGRVRAAAA
jgi:hypothetical protein